MYSEYTQAMFGKNARQVPCWLYVQKQSNEVVTLVGASKSLNLCYGGELTHQFILGEIVVRPHFVVESNIFQGHGLSGLVTANAIDFIHAEDRRILCDPLDRLKDFRRDIMH